MEQPSPPPITSMPLVELHQWWRSLRTSADTIKSRIQEIEGELTRRFGNDFKNALTAQTKLSGEMAWIEAEGNSEIALKGAISKKVEWDSDRLLAVASTMSWDAARTIFKFKAEIPEAIYKGLAVADEKLREQINAARTVTYGEPKVTFHDKAK
jgi:DNA repair ATPase RecN